MRVHAVCGAKDAGLSVTAAYDAIAADYDAQVRGDEWMRLRLHRHYGRVFRPGERVLDVGCGTGLDAVALARLGLRVVGVDGSAAMVARCRARITSERLGHRADARVLRIEDLSSLGEERFDGLVSAFASLSSVADLGGFADDAARLVRPGGRVIVHMLNRLSSWEWLGFVTRRDWSAVRRLGHEQTRHFVIGGVSVQHQLYYPRQAFGHFFGGAFELRGCYSLGALRPPHTVTRIPRGVVNALEWLDLRLGGWPLVRDAGRFFVLDLERRAARGAAEQVESGRESQWPRP